jgi:hypothetical protein
MLEIFAAVASIGIFIALLVRFPVLRVVTALLVFLASALVWWTFDHQQSRRALAHQLIPLEAIELQGLQVTSGGDLHHLTGSARNASDYVLTELIIEVSAAVCENEEAPDEACEVVGSGLARAHSPWRIPPGESRDLDIDFRLRDMTPKDGALRWRYAVAETRASLDF